MIRTPILAKVLIFVLAAVYSTQGHSQSRDPGIVKPTRVNPYRNLKSSVFLQYNLSPIIGNGYLIGAELRRFVSLTGYVYLDAAYGNWHARHDRIRTSYATNSSFDLSSQSFTVRAGYGKHAFLNVILGVHYLFGLHLVERMPDKSINAQTVLFEGDISGYVRPVIPFLGYEMRLKLVGPLFLGLGAEIWFGQGKVFAPLQNHWRVPNEESPFLTYLKNASTANYFLALHAKL